ncbi:MAG: hypothetical protein JNM43_09670 [Planctomycetaceae bacterium]|nr:hypothetical protein [Planctomycetaceae bacterium]
MSLITQPARIFLFFTLLTAVCQAQESASTSEIRTSPDRYAGLRKPDKANYQVEVRFLSVTERLYDLLKESASVCEPPKNDRGPFDGWQQLEPGQTGVVQASSVSNPQSEFQLAMLSDEQMFQLIQSVQGDTRSNIMMAPRLLLPAGETGSVSDLSGVRCQKKSRTGQHEIVEVKEGTEISVRVTPLDQASAQVDVALDLHEILNREDVDVLDSGVLSRVPKYQTTSTGCSGIVKTDDKRTQSLVLFPAEFPIADEPEESSIQKVSQKIGLKRPEADRTVLVLCVTVVRTPQ